MRRIAILNCQEANDVCTGEACLAAFRQRTGAFARWAGEEAELTAFLRCNGCAKPPESDPGLREKLDRLQALGVDTLHLGVCTVQNGSECPRITRIAHMAEERGMQVVRGTHPAAR